MCVCYTSTGVETGEGPDFGALSAIQSTTKGFVSITESLHGWLTKHSPVAQTEVGPLAVR